MFCRNNMKAFNMTVLHGTQRLGRMPSREVYSYYRCYARSAAVRVSWVG
jgi:hypothetical protein